MQMDLGEFTGRVVHRREMHLVYEDANEVLTSRVVHRQTLVSLPGFHFIEKEEEDEEGIPAREMDNGALYADADDGEGE